MQFDKFVEESRNWWEVYLRRIARQEAEGRLTPNDGKILFPNMILATQCNGFYLLELIGATPNYRGLVTKRHREASIFRYLSQFDDSEPDPLFRLDSYHQTFRFLCLSQEGAVASTISRFPQLELYESTLFRQGGHGSVFSFGDNFRSCAVENSILLNTKDQLVRCKGILWLGIFRSTVSRSELLELFVKTTEDGEVKGVHCPSPNDARLVVAGQLQSMYLFPGLRETTLGEFFNLHPEIIKRAFNTDHFEYEPYLEWIEHDGTVTDTAINPDLLVQRPDGFFDIYDLKTALLDRTRITKATRNRRRFIDYVEEGVSQLANYREYFEYPANAAHAIEKYNLKVSNPRLILVVGNFDNANVDEIQQACRKYQDVDIIDYDTVCQMFMGAPQADVVDANGSP